MLYFYHFDTSALMRIMYIQILLFYINTPIKFQWTEINYVICEKEMFFENF